MSTAKQAEAYCDRAKTHEDIEAERALHSALHLTEAVNTILTQAQKRGPMEGDDQIMPILWIIKEVERLLYTSASHFCAPSSAEMDIARKSPTGVFHHG